MSHILVIDTGSSSMRGVLFDQRGRMCFTTQQGYTMRTRGDAAEYDPQDFQQCLMDICGACAAWCREHSASLEALSFTSQRSSILPMGGDGQPLCPIITWYDKRSASICRDINARHGEALYQLTGMKASPVLSAPKMAWLRVAEPALYDAADRIIGIQDYLIYLCTGVYVTDTSLASRTNLMNIRTRQWDQDLLSLYGLDASKLTPLVPPCTIVGRVCEAFGRVMGIPAGTPVVAGGGDQQCSVLGQGLLHPGAVGLTCGSGAYLSAICDTPVLDDQMSVNLNAAISPDQWVLEASTLSSGTVQDWLNRLLYGHEVGQTWPVERLYAEASNTPAGARGLIMLPDLAGKGCPDWNDFARGAFLNVSFAHQRSDFARAMLEGLAAEIAECYEKLHYLLPDIEVIRATGGLTKSDLFNQIIADMIDFPIEQCHNKESTATGAYLAAACALGQYASLGDAFAALPAGQNGRRFLPDPERHALYRRMNRQRRGLYEALCTGFSTPSSWE